MLIASILAVLTMVAYVGFVVYVVVKFPEAQKSEHF